jgi:hypothetical protein
MHVSLSPHWAQQNFKMLYCVARYPVFNDFFLGNFSATQWITVHQNNSPLFGVVFKFLPYSILKILSEFTLSRLLDIISHLNGIVYSVTFQFMPNIDVQFIRAVDFLFFLLFIAKLFMTFNPLRLEIDIEPTLIRKCR